MHSGHTVNLNEETVTTFDYGSLQKRIFFIQGFSL